MHVVNWRAHLHWQACHGNQIRYCNLKWHWIKESAPLLGLIPFCKVIPHTTFRNKECITDGKPRICKVVFTCWDMKVCHVSIIEHCRVCHWSIPSAKYIIKDHIKPTNGQAVLCDTTFAITSSLTHFCRSITVYVSSIDGTKGVLKKGVIFRII